MTTERTFFPQEAREQMERVYRSWDAGIEAGDISSIGKRSVAAKRGPMHRGDLPLAGARFLSSTVRLISKDDRKDG